jgi:hypothetical protein
MLPYCQGAIRVGDLKLLFDGMQTVGPGTAQPMLAV